MTNKSREQMILEISEDLKNMIDYEFCDPSEYGKAMVDYYGTAINLYYEGYRKVKSNKKG